MTSGAIVCAEDPVTRRIHRQCRADNQHEGDHGLTSVLAEIESDEDADNAADD